MERIMAQRWPGAVLGRAHLGDPGGDERCEREMRMSALHPVTQTFIAILDNQVARTAAGLKALREDVLMAAPGEQTRSIFEIGRHLLSLRRIQLKILAPPLLEQMPNADSMPSVDELRRKLALAAELL